jgi:tRNA nucleotidyltransferase (CCA-adding enzyme)
LKIIVTHKNSDFDALASLVAAHKLHPDALPVLGHLQNSRVQAFLRLHKDAFDLKNPKEIDWENVSDIIMVDFHELSRADGLENLKNPDNINWTIYDHHPEQKNEVSPVYAEIRETGSTVGILVKRLQEKKIKPTFLEATLMAIGIYADTGHLTFPNTTVDDVMAVAWLLENEADLNIVAEYTSLALQDQQIDLMNELMGNIEIVDYGFTKILFCHHSIDKYVADLSVIAHKLSDFYTVDIIFLAVKMQKWCYVIAQANSSTHNVLKFLADYEAKGHKQSAFAKVKADRPANVIRNIKEKLENFNKTKVTAGKIMSTPVRTLSKTTTIETAHKLMLRYGHNGFIVVDGATVEGIISRRDIEKAAHHKMGSHLVQDFMSHYIVTIKPETTFDEIEKLMIDNNMGRFPVIDRGKLVGIVTRTNILKELYNKEITEDNITVASDPLKSDINLIEQLENYFEPVAMKFLKKAGEIADKLGHRAYLVGGGVRDLILDNSQDVDIDIVIEGNAIDFAREMAKEYKAHLTVHEKYGTAKIRLPEGTVDLATARTEFYEYPAANPDIIFSTIKHDLYRRDFTINALAIHLNSEDFGKLLDFFNGFKDIKNKRIRVLHNFSFIEDPNRIFRAVRLERKLGFTIGRMTSELAVKAMNTAKFDYFVNDRIKNEIKIIFTNRYKAILNIKRLAELNALRFFEPSLEFTLVENKLKRLARFIEIFKRFSSSLIEEWVLFITVLLNEIKDESNFEKMLEQLRFSREERKMVTMSRDLPFVLDKYNWKDIPDSDICYFWKKYPSEALIYAMATVNDKNIRKSIYKYWTKLKDIKLGIDGNYLKTLGVTDGREIGDILESVLLAKLNGKVINLQDEYDFSKSLIKK